MCPTRFLLSHTLSAIMMVALSSDFKVLGADELVQTAAPARFTGFSTFGSLAQEVFRGEPRGPLIFKIAIFTLGWRAPAPPRAVGSGSVECG